MSDNHDSDPHEVLINDIGIGQGIGKSQVVKLITGNTFLFILILFDSWSNNCLFDKRLQKYMKDIKRTLYNLNTMNGNSQECGSGTLTFEVQGKKRDVQGLLKKFDDNFIPKVKVKIPGKWKEMYQIDSDIETPSGIPMVILGSDCLDLFPEDLDCHEGLLISKSKFDNKAIISGFNREYCQLVGGSSNNIKTTTSNFIQNKVQKVKFNSIDEAWIQEMNPQSFIIQPKLCEECRNKEDCLKCKLEINTKTSAERLEEQLLDDSTQFDPEKGKFVIDAPYKSTIRDLPSYKSEVTKSMEKLASKLKKIPDGERIATSLDKAIQDNLEKGNYIWEEHLLETDPDFKNLQESFQPLNYSQKISETHSCRLVHNFSFSRYGKPSYNHCNLKGGSLNHKLHHILLNQRGYRHQIYQDLQKMYNSCLISRKDKALCKMIYKKDGILSDGPWCVLITNCLQFGMTMSQHVANYAKLSASKMFVEPISSTAHHFICLSFTDDISPSHQSSMGEAVKLGKIIDENMNKAGFKCKPMTKSLDTTKKEERMVPGGSSQLGMFHHQVNDCWGFKVSIFTKPKVRGLRPEGSELDTREKVTDFINKNGITKKLALSWAHCCFDPLSLIFPIKLNLSVMYRRILIDNPHLPWESLIDSKHHDDFAAVLHQVLEVKDLRVPRCPLPPEFDEATGLELHLFSDGSGVCSIAKAFCRIATKNEDRFLTSFICASMKLAELGPNAAPKTEVTSLVLSCRLLETIKECWSHIKITRICFFSDSKVVLASLKTFYAKLKLFFSSRILECQSVILKHGVEVFHVPGTHNYANEGSKFDVNKNHVMDPSFWKAEFLEKKEEHWPVEQFDVTDEALELLQSKIVTSQTFQTIFLENCLNNIMQKYKSFKKLSRIIGYVFKMLSHVASGKPLQSNGAPLPDMIQKAEDYLMSLANPPSEAIEGLKRQYLVDKTDDGTYLITRAFQMESKVIQQRLRLLDGNSTVAKSILRDIHLHCCGSDKELATMMGRNLFITHARKFLRDLQNSCITCKKIRKVTAEFYMGPSLTLMSSRFPPYYRTHTDVYGPLYCKLTRNIKKKFWVALFSCAWSRHVTLTMLLDMTAAEFLQALKTVSYQNAGSMPRYLHADFGTNIVGITKIDDRENEEDADPVLDVQSLAHVLGENKIELKLSSAGAPWRQGASESLCKVLGQTLKRTNLTSQNYHLTQWTHLLSFLSFTINERSLCTRFSMESLTSVTPNKLVAGTRGNFFSASRMKLETDNIRLYRDLSKLEQELRGWRKVWNLTYLQSVKKYLKFKNDSKDVKEKSVVLISDHENPETFEPCLGQVVKKLSDRTFKISYIKKSPKIDNNGKIVKAAVHGELTRPIQKLVFLFDPDEDEGIDLDPFTADYIEENPDTPASTPAPTPTNVIDEESAIVDIADTTAPDTTPDGAPLDVESVDISEPSSHAPTPAPVPAPDSTIPTTLEDVVEAFPVPETVNMEIEDEFSGDIITDDKKDITSDNKSEPVQADKATELKAKPTLKVKHVGDKVVPKVVNIIPLMKKKPRKAKKYW